MNKQALQIHKSLNEDLMQATFVVMVPNTPDLHGDVTSVEEVRKACFNYNTNCGKANLFHMVQTETFSIVESYVSPVDFVLNDRIIKSGTWLCTVQCNDSDLWALIKSEKINGVSIGAMAKVETLQEDDE